MSDKQCEDVDYGRQNALCGKQATVFVREIDGNELSFCTDHAVRAFKNAHHRVNLARTKLDAAEHLRDELGEQLRKLQNGDKGTAEGAPTDH